MIEDVYEPLARYRDEFRETFARLTREKFQELTDKSAVDVKANRVLVGQIAVLTEGAASTRRWMIFFTVLGVLGILAVVFPLGFLFFMQDDPRFADAMIPCIVSAVLGAILGAFAFVKRSQHADALKRMEQLIDQKTKMAWQQMEPLNRLFTWDITTRLIEATVPRLAFDPYFSASRLDLLKRDYGWDDTFNDGKSMTFAQSGVINGNPFVFGQYLEQDWGSETYHGSLHISWLEEEEDSEGRTHMVRRSQTLTASVEKPIPVYSEQKFLLYGNDAAPNLSFSRKPSGFTGRDDTFLGKWKMKRRLNDLKDFSRNLTDDSDFTLMSNHEFETWFGAKNRDNEVEFRLLFTPIAQTQMLKLMKDRDIGYGDDFSFLKQQKINLLTSVHLNRATIDTDPKQFQNWNYDEAYHAFIQFNERYFKNAYFSLAPLLAIPLYQQTRPEREIWAGVVDDGAPSSFWEQEATANYLGEDRFCHPSCVTRSILKAHEVRRKNGVGEVSVTAYGFRGENRVDYVPMLGGDGNWHDVPVKWTEYLPVYRTSKMSFAESSPAAEILRANKGQATAAASRRAIYALLRR